MNKLVEKGKEGWLFQEAVDVLTSQGKFYINLGLDRVKKFLDLIENPQKGLKFVHVAGTNGKGSVCAILSSVLMQSGYKTGLFTSPHVYEYTERIKINDIEIEKQDFAQRVIDVTRLSLKNEIHLTEFEILTVAAFQYFAQNNVDIVVLETGLGGRFDSTNVIEENICSIITHIDFDHKERLGDRIEKISFEKAGIIKSSCPVVVSNKNLGFQTIKKVAKENKSQILLADEGQIFLQEKFALKGTYQKENLALALRAIEILKEKGFKITRNAIEKGLENVKHPCRFEYLKEENILIDGAHNPNGTKALRESIDYYFPNQKVKFIFGCLKNKEYKKMMKNLFSQKDEIYFYHFDNPNACSYEDLSSACNFSSKQFDCFKRDKDVLTVICGSFYMLKELLQKMGIK